ncbi:SDR family oxidoreductase [Williamsia deligens]
MGQQMANLGLSGHVVLVTGGARGVGAGICTVLADLGAVPVACARRPPEPGGALPDALDFVACDVRDADAVAAMVSQVTDRHGRLDGLVNNAGGAPFSLASDASDRFHRKIVELNLLAPLLVAQAARASLARSGGGSIVNVSSVSGHRPSPGTAGYGAAKAGLDSLTGSLAVEWAPTVRVNSVVAGPVETELSAMHYGDADGVAAVGRTIPMGRMARPTDVGHAVAFLLSPLASYITGSVLTVHGGGERPAFLDAGTTDNRLEHQAP